MGRALLPASPGLDLPREDGDRGPARARPRLRREALVRAAAWLAVPSIVLNVALLRTDSAAEPSPESATAPVATLTVPAPSPQTGRPIVQPKRTSGVASARHERVSRPRPHIARRLLRWPASTKATAYDVVVWRGHRRIADVWTTKPNLAVAALACHGARPLAAGRYLWFVYPLVDAQPRRYGRLAKWGEFAVAAGVRCRRYAKPAR